jgi:hypothetical protein
MRIQTTAPTIDGLGTEGQLIELARDAHGQLVLGTQPVRCISIRDHCLVALGILGETRYVQAGDYWRAARGGKGVTEREAGCMLAHLDALKLHVGLLLDKLAANGVLDKEQYPQVCGEVDVLRPLIDMRIAEANEPT